MPIPVWQPIRAKDAGRIERRFRTLAMISRERELAAIQRAVAVIKMSYTPKARTVHNNLLSMRDIGFGIKESGLRESGHFGLRDSGYLLNNSVLSPRESIAASVVPASPRAFTPSGGFKPKTQVIVLEGDAGVGRKNKLNLYNSLLRKVTFGF
jgi:hypothetical protein